MIKESPLISNEDIELKRRYEQIKSEVEKTTDALGKEIDEGIREAVILLKLNGFETSGSCEGHLDWGLPYPWIDIINKNSKNDRLRRIELSKKYTEKNISQAEMDESILLNRKIKKNKKKLGSQIESLLKDFYKNRNVSNMLCAEERATRFRLQQSGADKFEALGRDKKISESEKKERRLFLDESKKEMDDFIDFLKKRTLT